MKFKRKAEENRAGARFGPLRIADGTVALVMEGNHQPDSSQCADEPSMVGIVERNIQALLETRRAAERQLGWQERVAAGITRFGGSMPFVYLHAVVYGLWIAINLGWLPFIPRFDPTFVVLAMEASVEAIFLSTFILITQNRMMALADKRADLNLQISLLAEHEITRLIKMLTEISNHMGLQSAKDPELSELSRDVHPERVLETMEKRAQRAG